MGTMAMVTELKVGNPVAKEGDQNGRGDQGRIPKIWREA